MDVAVKNAALALRAVLGYMQDRQIEDAPAADTQWQERILYCEGPEDLAVTSRLFTAGDWTVEISHNVAPLIKTVYQVAVFNTKLHSYWKGDVKAGSGLVEVSAFGSLSEEESLQAEAEFMAKCEVPPPKPGGYGH
jgi:hypothetical protein